MIGKYQNNFKISQLSSLINAKYDKKTLDDVHLTRILTQSVYTKPGDAIIVGPYYNKDKTIKEALEKGASVIFCEKEYVNKYSDKHLVEIDDPIHCIEKIANYCENGCNAKRITITGSVGKTTTTGLINSVIDKEFNTLTTHSMSNSHGAILRHFQQLLPTYDYWVQEVGGVQPGYIECSAKMLKPDVVVLTNIGISHMDLYGSKEGIFYDKSSLERYAKDDAVVIINADDEILKNSCYTHKLISCSILDRNANYYADNIVQLKDGIEFDVICEYGVEHIKLNLYGKYNVYNALFAIAVGCYANVPLSKIAEDLKSYRPDGMRQNMQHIGGDTLLIDCFNAEPKTVLGSAETLSEMVLDSKEGRKIFVTGHIDKIGEKSVVLHKELGEKLAKLDIDIILLYAGDSKYTYEGLTNSGYENAILFETRDELDDWIRNNVNHNDITFYKSGQFEAALIKTIDHVYGTNFQNEQQFNEGISKTEGDFALKVRKDDIVEIVKYLGNEINPTIPQMIDDGNVIRINIGAFRDNKYIERIIIPSMIEYIGREAFYLCRNLKEIYFNTGLKYISRSAFNYCISLKRVILPEGLRHIEMRAFRDCKSMERIYIPSTVGYIGEEAFYNCRNLTIECEKDSYAHQYASDNDLNFILV